MVAVRYIVHDADPAVAFYTRMLGFTIDSHPNSGFASLKKDDLRLLLNKPGAGGAGQVMPDGSLPTPGGWNRIQIEVADLDSTVSNLRKSGANFRNDITTGVGGRQILLEDPSGNLIELFQPSR